MTTWRLDTAQTTVLAVDDNGEERDLNTSGLPCESIRELARFIMQLQSAGAFGWETAEELLADIGR